jgi:hypothetical protein
MFDFNSYYQKALNIGYRPSAFSPLLWMNGLISAPCFMLTALLPSPFQYAMFSLGGLVVLYTLGMYTYLVMKDPRLVQSEKFQIEMQKLDIIAEKGGPIIFDPVNIPLSEDPKQLPEPES